MSESYVPVGEFGLAIRVAAGKVANLTDEQIATAIERAVRFVGGPRSAPLALHKGEIVTLSRRCE